MRAKAAQKPVDNYPIPTRFDKAEKDFLKEIAKQTALKKSDIIRRACRYAFPKFLKGDFNILDIPLLPEVETKAKGQ